MANIPEYKKKLVQDMTKLMKQYSIVAMVNMEDMPAPQLQSMRSELRGKIDLFMTKKRLMRIALEKMKDEKKGIEELEKYFEGMPALIFTNENTFKLSKILQKSKSKAPAKAGQTAPEDIVINKGPTPFAPGPVISELSAVGLKVGVEDGKVAVKEDSVVARKGEKIKPKVAEILTRLDIKPMEVGLGLVAAYEDGIIYQKDILKVDEKEYADNINLAASQAFNLAFNITYVTKDNISALISKSFNDAKALGISQKILDKGIIEDLLGNAEMSMQSLKSSANIEVTEAQKEKKEEPKPEEKVEEKKEAEEKPVEVKQEEPAKEEPKPEEKKIEAPTIEKVEQKETEVLEQEKKIIEEEKELEKEKPKDVPIEAEVQEEVKKEEEKSLEKERIGKEKELEKVEEQKPEEKVDDKVSKMVEQTKKFAEGKEETAADIIEEVKEKELEEKKEEKVPSAHDLKKKKQSEEKPEGKEAKEKEQKEVEDLTKELLKKGTLRK
jgi:large subunit ribosomal protein L10|tara:strand:- start:1636 stop:3123 length:1488 start_codon:yes stop_codon:yes gene_type:complete